MTAVAALGRLLRDAGYTGIRHPELAAVPPPRVLARHGRTGEARLATLVGLFDAGWTVTPGEAAGALSPLEVADLLRCGLLEHDGEGVRATVRLVAFDGAIVAGDPLRAHGEADRVIPFSAASERMVGLTVRRRVGTALDLGTGSGIHAVLAARHTEHVIATDISAHALKLADHGARLSGVENVEWVKGDWFEPVGGRRFDLVIANPPVIISPECTLVWRDSPIGGEELSRRLVAGCAEHLTEGGFASVCCHWAHAADEEWAAAPTQWVAGRGCDAVVLRLATQAPLEYALLNIIDRPDPDRAHVGAAAARWVAHYRRAGIERITIGVLVLRRRESDANWTQRFELNAGLGVAGSDQLERIFAARDALADRSGAGGLAATMLTRWRPCRGDRIDQTLIRVDGAYQSAMAVLARSDPGMSLFGHLDPRVLPVIVGCDGRRPLAQVLRESAPPPDLAPVEFHSLCLGTVRELVARGLLVAEAA